MRKGCIIQVTILLGILVVGIVLFGYLGPPGASSTLGTPRPIPPALAWHYAATDAREKNDVALLQAMTKSTNEWASYAGASELRQMPLDGETLHAFREMLWGSNVRSQYAAINGIHDGVANKDIHVSPLPPLPGYESYLKDPDSYITKWKTWLSKNYGVIQDYLQTRDSKHREGQGTP